MHLRVVDLEGGALDGPGLVYSSLILGYIGIMENNMETTTWGLWTRTWEASIGFRVWGLLQG